MEKVKQSISELQVIARDQPRDNKKSLKSLLTYFQLIEKNLMNKN